VSTAVTQVGPVVTNAPASRPGGPPRWTRVVGLGDSVIAGSVARRHGAIHIDNSHREVAADLMSADGIHFNRRGHAHIADTVAEVLGLTG
jgi:lysophospholipase L1-like esterase